GVAHDFNNLLQVVEGNLELLAADLSTPAAAGLPAAVQRRLGHALAGAERGARLTRQLLAFSRRQPLTPKWVDVLALVSGMSDMLARTLGERIEVAILGDQPSWTVLVDPTQLENAVLNLAINARDAMPEGGRLTIETRNRRDPSAPDDLWLEIAVSDTGVGMTPQVLARVYEPFFSTKPEGRGTGLGLPQVQGFIAQSNGRMEIESAPGAGAVVRLFLPASATRRVEQAAPRPADARGRGERILVLEDDDAVRRAVADLVRSLGYEVTEAASTAEGARVLAESAGFDLLLSDVVMPGTPSPPEFARAAQAARPSLKVLFMSGYAEDVVVHQGRVDADIHLIEKPYRKDALSLALRRLLDEAPPAAVPVAATDARPRRRVLLVEDDALIAMAVADLLDALGYEVIEARDAAAAQAAARNGAPIDIALTDLGLPDMDGEELAGWLRAERPGLPIVFATGRSEFQPSEALAAGGPTQVVTKPFNTRVLQEALAACGA
ncbi:response regulator, partial [Methylopila musalis]